MADLSQLSMAFDTGFQPPIEEPDADVSLNKINRANKRNQGLSVEPLDLQTQLKQFYKKALLPVPSTLKISPAVSTLRLTPKTKQHKDILAKKTSDSITALTTDSPQNNQVEVLKLVLKQLKMQYVKKPAKQGLSVIWFPQIVTAI